MNSKVVVSSALAALLLTFAFVVGIFLATDTGDVQADIPAHGGEVLIGQIADLEESIFLTAGFFFEADTFSDVTVFTHDDGNAYVQGQRPGHTFTYQVDRQPFQFFSRPDTTEISTFIVAADVDYLKLVLYAGTCLVSSFICLSAIGWIWWSERGRFYKFERPKQTT